MIDFKVFYGLEYNPFEKGQKLLTVESLDYKEMLGRLNYLKDIRGIGLFTGSSGLGKTLTLKNFCDSLNPGLYQVIYLPLSTLTTNDFYRGLASGLGLEPRQRKIDNYKNIQDHIKKLATQNRITPVIVLDEAQYLKTDTLNDLKLLLNFEFDSKNYAILILAGLPNLVNTLNKSVHESLRQRVVVTYRLAGLDESEIKCYIEKKLLSAGCHNPLFTDSALTALTNASTGSSRKLNHLVTQALILGANQNRQLVDHDIVMQASLEVI